MERCGRILRNTLQFSPGAPRERALGRLNEVVLRSRDLVLAAWRRGPATILLNLDPADPEVAMNELEIELALINLANNALQNGSATTGIVLTTAASPGLVMLTVSDDGPGMTPLQKRRAFDPFFTTRRDQGGSGLGLCLVHDIVVSHRGTIDIDSEPGPGTIVRICLPRFPRDIATETTV
jgi:two-component system NtrC family sensor kinase